MEMADAFLLALRALGRNKMRSILTMLGMIIGVGAVIAVIGIGQGAAAKAQEQLAALGSNMLFVGSGSVNRYGLNVGSGQTKTPVLSDARATARECPSVSTAAPGVQTGQQVVFGNQNWATQVMGTEPQYFEVRNLEVEFAALPINKQKMMALAQPFSSLVAVASTSNEASFLVLRLGLENTPP